MPPIWALLNSNLVIAGLGAIVLQYIRDQHQTETKKNALRMEWFKKTNEEQTKLLNELSTLIASVNTGSLIFSQTIVEKALDLVEEKVRDFTDFNEEKNRHEAKDEEKNEDTEQHEKTWPQQFKNWVNPLFSHHTQIPQRVIKSKPKVDNKYDVIKENQNAFDKNIRNWMEPILSNYYQIQRLTKPKSKQVTNLFKAPDIKAEILAIQAGIVDDKTTLATLIQMLQNKTLELIEYLEDLTKQKKKFAKWNQKRKPNSEIPILSEDEKQQLIHGNFNVFLNSKDIPLCELATLATGELKALLSLLCTYQEVLNLLGMIDKQTNRFFDVLNIGFQAHLKTVDDYII